MTKEDIITLPNPILREKSKRVGYIDDQIKQLSEGMVSATLDWESSRPHETGAALAAIQIAQPLRVIVIRNNFDDKNDKGFTVLVNPEITKTEGEPLEEMEGCLSVSDLYGSVPRYPKVKVRALTLEGKEVRITATDFLARVLQHEIDHTNGMVFLDRITNPSKIYRLEPDGRFTPHKHEE